MVFKQFRINIIVRILALNATLLCLFWLMMNTNYYISIFSLVIIIILQIAFLINYTEQSTRMVTRFLSAIQYDDFAQNYAIKGVGSAFDDLRSEFEKVVDKFQEIRAEKEAQYHYLKTIVEHIAIGLMVLDKDENIELINPSASKLLGVTLRVKSLAQFGEAHQPLLNYIHQTKPAEKELVKLQQEDSILHLAVRSTQITLRGKSYKIISLQDIQSELEEKEMEAWQKLIRVLTHEIINSVTPIASLATSVEEDLNYYKDELLESSKNNGKLVIATDYFEDSMEDIHQAVHTIQKRSEGLIRFVQDFRNLTKIPHPNLEVVLVEELIDSVFLLVNEDFKKYAVNFNLSIQPQNLQVLADQTMLEQVLINLFKNACQALIEKTDRAVSFIAEKDITGKILMKIQDNGVGITEEASKKIFIPFFTTKKTGSGIGLSLSRQMMRLHGGNISVQSKLGEGTTFTLKFP